MQTRSALKAEYRRAKAAGDEGAAKAAYASLLALQAGASRVAERVERGLRDLQRQTIDMTKGRQ